MFLSLHTMLHSYVHVTGNAGWAGVGWGGVGMLTFGWSWTRHWCYAEHGVGWGCERSFEVEHATDATLSMGRSWSIHSILAMEMGKRVVSWPVEKTAQVYVHNDHWNWQGKKRSGFRVEGLPNARKNDPFFLRIFTLRRLRNTERVVIFWPWWCAYTRDSAPGGMFIYIYINWINPLMGIFTPFS